MDCSQSLEETDVDRRKLLSIFPEEIWQLILETIDNPEDLKNCAKASAFLGEVLEPRRTEYMFPQVLQVLDQQGYLNSPTSSILNCRLVCSTWKNAVNRQLEERPYHSHCRMVRDDCRDFRTDYSDDPAYHTYFRFYKFSIQKLQTEIIPDLSNPYYRDHCPFPSRHLEIIETPSRSHYDSYEIFLRDLYDYKKYLVQLLEKVGHHFRHAVIEFQTTIHHQQVSRLEKYLKLMPNLRSLYIVCSYGNSMSWNEYDYGRRSGYENRLEILLPQLNVLSICGGYEPLLRQLVGAAENVKIIEVRKRNSRYEDFLARKRRTEEFPIACIKNPEKLAIEIFSATEFRDLDNDWRLKVLRLKMDKVTAGTLRWSEIFWKLTAYQNSLEELTIAFPRETECEEMLDLWKSSTEHWFMPNLKILDLKIENFCSLDFLLGLRNLEKLYLRFGNRVGWKEPVDLRDKHGDKIDLRDFEGERIMDCNIWNMIPTLKQLYLDAGVGISAMKYRRDQPPMIWRNLAYE